MSDTPESTPWYKAAFRGEYLSLYTHRDDQEARDLAALTARVTGLPAGARVADVPCGGGRHMRAFGAQGWQVTGLDLSQDLLVAARAGGGQASARDPGIEVSEVNMVNAVQCDRVDQIDHVDGMDGGDPALARADIRTLPLPAAHFDLVANVFTSLGYFDDDRVNAQAVGELVRLVRPGGWLLVDFLDAAHVRATLEAHTTRTTPQGWLVDERREILPPDSAKHQVVPRVVKTITITKPESPGHPLSHREEVALLDREWFQGHLRDRGLNFVESHFSYTGEPVQQVGKSPRLILFAKAML